MRSKSAFQPLTFLDICHFKSLRYVSLGIVSALLVTLPVQAAEKVRFIYGPLVKSLPVSSLNNFAKDGSVDSDLKFYFKLANANAQSQQEFRKALTERVNVNPILISRFFYSELGADILTRLGQYIQTPQQGNGIYALRAALILSALDPEGLNLLNFINKYPTDLNLDIGLALEAFKEVERVIHATEFFTTKMTQFAAAESASNGVDYASMPDLRQPGPYPVRQQRWVLKDTNRDRQFYVIVVQPESLPLTKTPVIIFSHGLASRPDDFIERAKHLASYGFVVALPQHPGSDTEQVKRLQQGLSSAFFLTSELINRPQDLSYVIDELERRNQAEFGGKLETQSVGVIGHSFGGYGALAVAGATIDFDHLQQECSRPFGYINTSLLLQCRALQLPRQVYNFRDQRVKAVLAANPVNYSIFGSKGLSQVQIPALLAGGNYDPATPTALEQARSFPLLGSATKYLMLVEGQAHVNLAKLDAGVSRMLESIPGLTLASPDLIGRYSDAIFLAFLGTYVAENSQFQPYMKPAYATYLSQKQTFKLFAISASSGNNLNTAIAEFRSKYK